MKKSLRERELLEAIKLKSTAEVEETTAATINRGEPAHSVHCFERSTLEELAAAVKELSGGKNIVALSHSSNRTRGANYTAILVLSK